MKLKSVLALGLSLAMTLQTAVFDLSAESFRDSEAHWAKEEIGKWSDYGIIQGSGGEFRPDQKISRAEIAVIMDKLMGYQEMAENRFSDLEDSWYTDALLKSVANDILKGSGGAVRPMDKISRQEFAVVICRAFAIQPLEGATTFADDAAIAPWAKGYVKALSEKGYIKGMDAKRFGPNEEISRAAVVKLLDNMVTKLYNVPGTYHGKIGGNLVISKAGVEVKDAVIEGDLILAEGIGNGDVKLENVEVKGRVLAKGGGKNSIYFNNVDVNGALVINKKGGEIRIVSEGATKLSVVSLETGAIIVAKNLKGGKIEKIEIPANLAKDQKIVLDGSFNKVENKAKDAKIKIEGSVETLILKEKTEVTGTAMIKQVETAKGADSVVNGKAIKENEKKDLIASKPSNPESKGGAPGGGASSGGGSLEGGGSSSGGSSSGGSSGGSSSGGNSSEPGSSGSDPGNSGTPGSGTDPQQNTEFQPAVNVDPRFAEGYPKANINSEGKLEIKVKLKEAPAEPAEVFAVANIQNHSKTVSKDAVLWGLFETDNRLVWANEYPYLKITDAGEHLINTDLSINDSENGIGVALVLKIGDDVSEAPAYLEYKGKTANELDNVAPKLWFGFINKDKNKIVLYTSEGLDGSKIPSTDSFRLSKKETKVREVKLINVHVFHNIHSIRGILLELENPVSDITDLRVIYTKPTVNPIQDLSGNPLNDQYLKIESDKPQINNVHISSDGRYISLIIKPDWLGDDNESIFWGYGLSEPTMTLLPKKETSFAWDHRQLFLDLKDNVPSLVNDGRFFFKIAGNMSTRTGDPILELQGQGVPNDKVEDTVRPESITFDQSEQSLTVSFSKESDLRDDALKFSCYFTVNKNGKKYHLRGSSYFINHQIKFNEAHLNHIPEDFWKGATLTYSYENIPFSIYNAIAFLSGKPYAGFSNLPITVVE